MVTFIIIRHGYSQFNKERKFTGQLDVPLDELGIWQAERAAEAILRRFSVDAIYSSDLSRTMETVRPLAQATGLEIVPEKGLREMDVGCWQGVSFDDVKRLYPEQYHLWLTNVGLARAGDGESSAELIVRAEEVFHKIAEENEGKTVVVSTHGGVIRALRCGWMQIPPEGMKEIPHVANASITVAEYDAVNRSAQFCVVGDEEHLEGKATSFSLLSL